MAETWFWRGSLVRVSEYYSLDRSQGDLDFVDVDTNGDVQLFVDPRALRLLPSEWGAECRGLLQNFFHTVLDAIRGGNDDTARTLLVRLREPNETHLGLSRDKARGHALGPESAEDVWEALSESEAVQTGLLQDLEEAVLLVPGIGPDIVSDIATNVIREPLIRYTQVAAAYYGISLSNGIDSGPLWDPAGRQWHSEFVQLPCTADGKLLLVPKSIVRRKTDYNISDYYRNYVIEHLRHVEEEANTELVHLLRNGDRRVYIKELKEKYGTGKHATVHITRQFPAILETYRKDKRNSTTPPLDHEDISEFVGAPQPNLTALLGDVQTVPAGKVHADEYHAAVEKLLSALFYPDLTGPEVQFPIHDGRKIIDIRYTNTATLGFFFWLGAHFPAPYIYVECKNYRGDLKNPELDQLAGRFSPARGKFGLLLCRSFKDKARFLRRCKDTMRDDRGYIIVMDDSDLAMLVKEFLFRGRFAFDALQTHFDELIN